MTATFYNYAVNEGETLNDWEPMTSSWVMNDKQWITVVLNLMDDEACMWALPHLENLARRGVAFSNYYNFIVEAFTKRFAPLNTTKAARDTLKALKQGKSSMVEYISKFNQFTQQTGWSDADHCIRFYDGLNEAIKDNLAISDRPIATLTELRAAAQILDQCMCQCAAEKSGKTFMQMTQQALSKDPNAMDVDASHQSDTKEVQNCQTYIQFMQGKCYRCGSTEHSKADRKHEQDVCNHCKKVEHHSPVCMAKYLGKKVVAAKATASSESPPASSSTVPKEKAAVSATSNKAPATDSKAQADLLAKLMAQVEVQSKELAALKASFQTRD